MSSKAGVRSRAKSETRAASKASRKAAPAEPHVNGHAIPASEGMARLTARLEKAEADNSALRSQVSDLQARLDRTTHTIAYQLGHTLMATRSLSAVLSLPGRLLNLRQEAKGRQNRTATLARPEHRVGSPVETPSKRSAALVAMVKEVRSHDIHQAVRLAELAYQLDPKPSRMKWLAGLQYDAGQIDEPNALYAQARDNGEAFSPAEAARAEIVAGMARLKQAGGVAIIPRGPRRRAGPAKSRILYMAASSQPYHISGYTTRTHSLVEALGKQGCDVTVATRAGYPDDRPDAIGRTGDARAVVDGVVYHALAGPAANSTPIDRYVDVASEAIARTARECGAQVIHAASNYVNGLPALVAARSLGLPFVYEVRGLWEFTAVDKGAMRLDSERFAFIRAMESFLAREADAVLTLSGGLQQELVARGAPAEIIHQIPNSVDVERFAAEARPGGIRRRLGIGAKDFVIGFIGSLTHYEGLDELVEVVAGLKAEGLNLTLLIVGDGPASIGLRRKAEVLGLERSLVMTGRIPPTSVPDYYGAVDCAAFPRRPSLLTDLVPPLKPLEAMAMGKVVVASNVGALEEMIRDGETGLLFEKGDRAALADAIRRVATNPDLRSRLAANARAWVEAERTWATAATKVITAYAAL